MPQLPSGPDDSARWARNYEVMYDPETRVSVEEVTPEKDVHDILAFRVLLACFMAGLERELFPENPNFDIVGYDGLPQRVVTVDWVLFHDHLHLI